MPKPSTVEGLAMLASLLRRAAPPATQDFRPALHLLQACSGAALFSTEEQGQGQARGATAAAEQQQQPAPQLGHLGAVPQPSVVSIRDDGDSSAQPGPRPQQGRPPRVLTVGGSIAGCCVALALGRIGCQVEVFERSSCELESKGAGLVLQPDLRDFVTYFGIMLEDVCVTSSGRQYINREGRVTGYDDSPQLFTGWDTLYRALKAKAASKRYHLGSSVERIELEEEGRVAVTLHGGQRYTGDLLVGADGGGSMVRHLFWPDTESRYAGYVCWRGFVSEQDCPPSLAEFISNRFTLYQGPHFHILAYVIPGPRGETEPGRRRVNWVWYWNTSDEELEDYLKDVHGYRHGHSVKKGLLRPEIAQARRDTARQLLPAPLADLVCGTSDIFMQAIYDMRAASLVHLDRVVLVGDSGCVLRPHTAAGTTKAAVNAWTLSRALQLNNFNLPAALHEYNLTQSELARYLVDVGVSIGTRSQFGQAEAPGASWASFS